MNIDIKSILKQLREKGLLEHTIITHTVLVDQDELVGKTDVVVCLQGKTLHNQDIIRQLINAEMGESP